MKYVINAKIHTMSEKGTIENGFVSFEDGKIIEVCEMSNLDLNNLDDFEKDCENIFDAKGLELLPGFIDAHSHIGIFGDSVGSEGIDANELPDPITPHLSALDGVNPLDRAFYEAAYNGVTTVVTGSGSANLFGGQLTAIKTAGSAVIDDLIVKHPIAIKAALGENPKGVHGKNNRCPYTRQANAALIRETLTKASIYSEKLSLHSFDPDKYQKPDYDAKLEALIPVIKKELPLHIHAHRADDIMTAVRICREFNIDYVLVHATEASLVVEELSKIGAKCIIGPIICDRSKPELYGANLYTADELFSHSVKYAVCTDHPVVPEYFLSLSAALTIKGNVTYEKALRSITSDAAEILGLSSKIGSIKPGLSADFVILDGKITDVTSSINAVFINGNKIK